MKTKISESIRERVLKEYYQQRARKAGSTKSPAKTLAARRASLLTEKRLVNLAKKFPSLAIEIDSYLMSVEQERTLKRAALIEKLEQLANEPKNGK